MSTTPDIVDWSLAVRVASSVAGRGPDTTANLRAEVRQDFKRFTRQSDDLVREFTGLVPNQPAPDPIVLDRPGWVRANVESFQGLMRPLAERLAGSISLRGPMRRITSGLPWRTPT